MSCCFTETKTTHTTMFFRFNVLLLWVIPLPQTGPMPSGICDLKDADDGLLALGADCEDSAWVNCTCCTCCEAPCAVVNMPLTRRILQEEVITMGKMDRLARKLFSFDDLLLS